MVQATFVHTGRVGNLVRLLSWHPSYLERFLTLLDVVMDEPGALLPHWRHYIAILVRYPLLPLILITSHHLISSHHPSHSLRLYSDLKSLT